VDESAAAAQPGAGGDGEGGRHQLAALDAAQLGAAAAAAEGFRRRRDMANQNGTPGEPYSLRIGRTRPRLVCWALALPLGLLSAAAGFAGAAAEQADPAWGPFAAGAFAWAGRSVPAWGPLLSGCVTAAGLFAAGLLVRPRHVVYFSSGGREEVACVYADPGEARAAREAIDKALSGR
jgi:hypothetical protein